MSKWRHVLNNIDVDNRTAFCEFDNKVVGIYKNRDWWVCKEKSKIKSENRVIIKHIVSDIDEIKMFGNCSICGLVRLVKNGGKYFACKNRMAEYRNKNKEVIQNWQRQYEIDNKIARQEKTKRYSRTIEGRFATQKSRAKSRGLEWSLSLEEFQQLLAQKCYYCNNELGKPSVTGSGLDRVDNSRGYHYDNVVPSCHRCNALKLNDLTKEETLAAVKAILHIRRSL